MKNKRNAFRNERTLRIVGRALEQGQGLNSIARAVGCSTTTAWKLIKLYRLKGVRHKNCLKCGSPLVVEKSKLLGRCEGCR